MKNRYGADGITYDSLMDTSIGKIEINMRGNNRPQQNNSEDLSPAQRRRARMTVSGCGGRACVFTGLQLWQHLQPPVSPWPFPLPPGLRPLPARGGGGMISEEAVRVRVVRARCHLLRFLLFGGLGGFHPSDALLLGLSVHEGGYGAPAVLVGLGDGGHGMLQGGLLLG